MFGSKDKRAAASYGTEAANPAFGAEAANTAFGAEVERLEALPMAQLAAEVMARGFGPGGYLPSLMQRKPHALERAYVSDVAAMFKPAGARDAGLYDRLCGVVGEGLQVLEHESLIWTCRTSESSGVGYVLTRRGRAVLEADAVEQTLRGPGPYAR